MDKDPRTSGSSQKDLVHLLHGILEEHGYIPPETIGDLARRLRISESEIYGVLTFYKAFSLVPRGKHTVTVCMGTACHVRGGPQIADEMERELQINIGETSADGMFTLETVNCLGCCAIAPVVTVDGRYFAKTTVKKVEPILRDFRENRPKSKKESVE